jgi:hypothetical protein
LGAKSEKYVYDGEGITVENLESFIARVQAGEIQQFLKSAEAPENND